MRRKNWIKRKKFFYDNFLKLNKNNKVIFYNLFLKKKEFIFDQYNTRGQLYKVYLNKNKNSFLESEFNYYYFSDFYKTLKFLNKKTIYKNFIQQNNNLIIFSPNYMFKSQFFSNKSLFNDLLINFKLKGFFLYKNFFKNSNYMLNSFKFKNHIIGYNFYIFNKSTNNININKLVNFIDDKEYNSIGKIKFIFKNNFLFKSSNELDVFFNFNLYFINVLEIYKICIFLYFQNFN